MIKLIAWDLDETLWSGSVGEENTSLNIMVRDFIFFADQKGILQSIVSRNDRARAVDVLRYYELEEYFLYPQFTYEPKHIALNRIIEHFNISADTIAFVDDDAFERYQVGRFLPDVSVYAPTELIALKSRIGHELQGYVPMQRRSVMQAYEQRVLFQERFTGTREEFLAECKMKLIVRPMNEADMDRVCELASRTNKMNNIRAAIDRDLIKGYAAIEGHYVFVCELSDIFGEHGIVGVCMIADGTIDVFCVSCRIEGRGVGTVFLYATLERLATETAIVNPTFKFRYKNSGLNRQVLLLLRILGFVAETGLVTVGADAEVMFIADWNAIRNSYDISKSGIEVLNG